MDGAGQRDTGAERFLGRCARGLGAGSSSGGGGSAGALTGTAESTITNLVSDLNARPIKGPGFGTNAVALIDQNGQVETGGG